MGELVFYILNFCILLVPDITWYKDLLRQKGAFSLRYSLFNLSHEEEGSEAL